MSKLLIGGQWVAGDHSEVLTDCFRGEPYGEMGVASARQVDEAVGAAALAAKSIKLSPDERYRILMRASELLQARKESLLDTLVAETGFPRGDGENEVRRCVQTLQLSAEEARRLVGELVPMQATPGLKNRMGYTILVPMGVVCAITPYNSPLNVVAHKIAPALAGGNVVVLKPSELTPLSAVALCEILIEAGLPPECITLLHGPGATIGRALLDDNRIHFYTFTGSTRVGREIQKAAGLRKTQLELGSIASTIVLADADQSLAASKIVAAGFRKAGQVCTSVQRVLIQREIYEVFLDKLAEATRRIPYGDPRDPNTIVGPMITVQQAERAEQWVDEAVKKGARVIVGGTRERAVFAPTILVDAPPDVRVVCEEVFAPLIVAIPFDTLEQAYERANETPYGLAAGLFTRDVSVALKAGENLQFGGVHINETSSSRVDVMPFGGVKDSGFGREGPRYAIREMMEERLVTIAY
ncbi:aldehyde dehydrogenase family protein [Bordetella sp. 15P40C-2]|uniref:aldehyde dehydrogenase family protein n=1 Tax=Bordetella sp. 15P40C-2 TaxID=2572246 RepID=UPI001328035B|nr:aldehyde dehydrogenase family protein [Bordetella sp. 15P40C-2]MVW72702.1 aldehyde dehydrogenase family protein [Bordetella sp. 15P40C-2]